MSHPLTNRTSFIFLLLLLIVFRAKFDISLFDNIAVFEEEIFLFRILKSVVSLFLIFLDFCLGFIILISLKNKF